MATELKLTRDQLASFLNDFEQVKQFEKLFATVQTLAPITGQDFTYVADNAQATANNALSQIAEAAQQASIESALAENRATQALQLVEEIRQMLDLETRTEALQAIETVARMARLAATAPVQQNDNSVVTDYVDLRTTAPVPADVPGRFYWNRDDGTMDLDQPGGTVLQVGQEIQYYAKNLSGGVVANGTPVMFVGTVGASAKIEFGLAVADGSVPADYMMGVATQDIQPGDFGYITDFGIVRGFNTTGTPYGEVWANGDLLYFSATTPGAWTKFKPPAPAIDVPVAVVLNAGPGGSGSIFVRMTIAEALSRLQDVFINGSGSPDDFDILIYDATQSRWENKPASAVQVLTWMGL
jgi:hypothetical protein